VQRRLPGGNWIPKEGLLMRLLRQDTIHVAEYSKADLLPISSRRMAGLQEASLCRYRPMYRTCCLRSDRRHCSPFETPGRDR